MVAGYPGRTRRHSRGSELRYRAEVSMPAKLAMYTEMGEVLREHAAGDAEAAARLSAPISYLANAEKNNRELLEQLSGNTLLDDKDAADAALLEWANADRKRRRTYGSALTELETVIAAQQVQSEKTNMVGYLMWIPDLLGVAHKAYRQSIENGKPDICLLYTSPSPRDGTKSRMPSSA